MPNLTVIFGGKEEAVHELTQPRVVVGREPSCDIAIDNLGISRQHCAFVVKGDTYQVKDLGSANGTYVNGKKVVEHYLNDEDEIVIGKFILRFSNDQQGAEVEAAESVVPDTLNTYVMDGNKIQEQLAKMRAQQAEAASESSADGSAAPLTAQDYAHAMNADDASSDTSNKKTIAIIATVAVIAVATVVALLLWK